jgi:hypothetical protein
MSIKWLPRAGDIMMLLGERGKPCGEWDVDEVIEAKPDSMDENDVVRWIRRVIDPSDDGMVRASARDDPGSHGLVKVVSAESMNADTLWRHCRVRHPELWYERRIPVLRDEHCTSHRLTQFALGHYHERADAE